MSVSKKFTCGSKGKPESKKCRITFKLSKELAGQYQAQNVRLAGTFNNWGQDDSEKYAMKVLKDGSFSLTITLPTNQEHLFKYVISTPNGDVWVTDDDEAVEKRNTDYENSFFTTLAD